MILTIPTKYAAGVSLWGDYWDLKNLHETIHSLVESTPFNEDTKEAILGLAYDIRHAYQRDREEREFGFDEYDKVTYRGEKVLWSAILFQVNALRYCTAFQPTSKEQQANLYRLESCLENSLNEQDAKVGAQCIEWLNSPLPITKDYYPVYLNEVSRNYITGPGGKSRFKKLPRLLRSLHPLSEEYQDFASHLEAIANEKGCSPYELHDFFVEWPEFEW